MVFHGFGFLEPQRNPYAYLVMAPIWRFRLGDRLLQVEVVVMHSYHTDQERAKIIDTFNQRTDQAQILILTFSIGGTGLNLQEMCFRVRRGVSGLL